MFHLLITQRKVLMFLFAMVSQTLFGQSPQPPQKSVPRVEPRSALRVDADAIREAQTHHDAALQRPEQTKTKHDDMASFRDDEAQPSSRVLNDQPEKGRIEGFDFYRDALNAKEPGQSFEATMKADIDAKPQVMAAHNNLLATRYELNPRFEKDFFMTRGKPIPIGPTARLANGLTWDALEKLNADEMRNRGLFPYPPLPHPKHVAGGQVFPKMQIQ